MLSGTAGLTDFNAAAVTVVPVGFGGTGRWSVGSTPTTVTISYTPDEYIAWSSGVTWAGGDSLQDGDPDKDGIPNLLEYATGNSPVVAGTSPAVAGLSGGNTDAHI